MDSNIFYVPRLRFRLPGVFTCLGVGCLIFVAWSLYSTMEEERKLEALFQEDLPALERLHSAELWAKRGEEAIPRLKEALQSPHDQTRKFALLALVYMPPHQAKSARDAVLEICEDENPYIQSIALGLAARLSDDPKALSRLAASRLLASEFCLVTSARDALDSLGPKAVPAIADTLPFARPQVKSICLNLLGAQVFDDDVGEQAVETIANCLRDPDLQVRRRAFELISISRPLKPAEVSLGLKDSEPKVVRIVLENCLQDDLSNSRDLPQLERLLHSRPELRILVFPVIALHGLQAKDLVAEIQPWTEDNDPAIRRAAASALVRVSPDFDRIRPALRDLLLDFDPGVARHAGQLWSEAAPEELAGLVRELLLPRVRSSREPAQISAAAALSGMPQAASAKRWELIRLLTKESSETDVSLTVQIQLAQALGTMGSAARDAVPAILGLIHRLDPSDPRTAVAVTALGNIGSRDHGVVETLIDLYERTSYPEPAVRIAVVKSLGRLGDGRSDVLDLLTREADSGNHLRVRMAALHAIDNLENETEYVQAIGSVFLNHELADVRLAALCLLRERGMTPSMAEPLGRLVSADESARIRILAAGSLETMGPQAAPALPDLELALDDPWNRAPFNLYPDEGDGIGRFAETSLPLLKRGSVHQAVRRAIRAIRQPNGKTVETAHR